MDLRAGGAGTLRERALGMAGSISHRGPDDEGYWLDEDHGVSLAHRRLSVIDLSPRGAQPMRSVSGRFTIVYNGEIYNFRQLRSELSAAGASFRGESDTEVVLAAFEKWGLRRALERFNGMFALAVWDAEDRALMLARDRIGEKPVYYGWSGGTFLFGSELKSLRAHPAFSAHVDQGAIALYLRHGYIPAPHTIYSGISKLPPGSLLAVPYGSTPETALEPQRYWSLAEVAHHDGQTGATDKETVDKLEELISDAVALRLVSDVPVGAFLSGGIDSSTVVALMQKVSTAPVRTFSIGFSEREHDEAPFARAVAAHLDTDHTELFVSARDALELIPRLPLVYDEPFGDSSAIPTTLLSVLTRRHVTVALSGDGGDELFGGYTRYERAERAWRGRRYLRGPAGRILATILRRAGAVGSPGRRERMHRYSTLLASRHPMEQYGAMTTYWDSGELLGPDSAPPTLATDPSRWREFPDPTQGLMYTDALMYLPDDILVKVDRASMSASLEARVPLLDHRVVEFAWSLPRQMRVRHGKRKWILRQVLARHVPPSLFERPKQGFAVPIGDWLRGPLREWAEELIEVPRLMDSGLSPGPIHARWRAHLAGAREHTDQLWILLMLQAWRQSNA